jgi:hypothetical protein
MLNIMAVQPPPCISSFIIRFVVENPGAASSQQPNYHGSIRHIQSNEEMNFSSWSEAEAFICRFVPLEEEQH